MAVECVRGYRMGYEYRLAPSGQVRTMINDEGWQVVPGQSEITYLRRPRLRLGR